MSAKPLSGKPLEVTANGTVKWFNTANGYGFITRQNGPDVFVHQTAPHTPIVTRDFRAVSFEVATGQKGLQAGKVEIGESLAIEQDEALSRPGSLVFRYVTPHRQSSSDQGGLAALADDLIDERDLAAFRDSLKAED